MTLPVRRALGASHSERVSPLETLFRWQAARERHCGVKIKVCVMTARETPTKVRVASVFRAKILRNMIICARRRQIRRRERVLAESA